ncbi:MAG: crossover junction endodeoxyribonuclease RuvC [Candidatus Taylorbacteria bacterium]|nr:crossover junction endodeoxyribonuclease RuvC [Candidatus Taylorbacteria bacterium]
MKVLAIDPGYEKVGVAVIEGTRNKPSLTYSACLKTKRVLAHEKRLFQIAETLNNLIERFKPNCLAIEELFFVKNQKTALKVAEARGVILSEAARKDIPVCQYTPLEVKIALTGYGRADKSQVTAMVRKLLPLDGRRREDDEFDAIAIGLTCLTSQNRFKI